jgi:nucleotide-binding universal stress UspA family protein
MQTILVPLDGSGVAEQALPYARLLARILAARIHLLMVVTDEQKQPLIARYAATPPGADGRYATDWDWDRRARSELTSAAEGYLIEQAQLLRTAGLHATYEVVSGTPAECIVAAAASEPEALISMTTHGYTGLRRWSLGSVADKVVHTGSRPIFLVLPPSRQPPRPGR